MTERVHIYDTTLRDGMQREGISLSVGEKLQVAHLLDQLGCSYIEAGFPASNPKDCELFEQLEREYAHDRARRGVRHDAPPRTCAPRRRGAARAGRLLRAGDHARRQDLGPPPRQGRARHPRREPRDDR